MIDIKGMRSFVFLNNKNLREHEFVLENIVSLNNHD